MGTCCETICKRRILFPSIQHLAWFLQGRPQQKQKCGLQYVKMAIVCTCGSNNWELLKIDAYILLGVWQALHCLFIDATYCVIIARASPGETKMWAAVRENGDFFARITGKRITGYMLRGVWQALNLSFHSCNVLRDCHRGVPGANKKWRPGYVKMTIFCNCGSNNWETVVDRQLTR